MSDTVLSDFRLSKRMRKILAPLARIVCPADLVTRDLTDDVIDEMELMMRAIPTYLRAGLVAGTLSFETGAIAKHGRPFTRLSPAQQEAYFAAWWNSPLLPIRQFAKGVKGLLAMGYWEHPSVKQRMEYHPERWIAEVAARRIARYADDIRKQDEMVLRPDPLVTIGRKEVKHDAA